MQYRPAQPKPNPKINFETFVGSAPSIRASHSSSRRAARSELAAYMCLEAQRAP